MAINKIVIGNEVKIDLTADTVTSASMLKGVTAHDKSGEIIEGSCSFDVDSSDATAAAAEVLEGKTYAARGKTFTGTMPNKGSVNGSISEVDGEFAIPMGFHDGSGKVSISATEQAKIIPSNIKKDVTILGVVGTHEGSEAVNAQTKTVKPTFDEQTVLPDEGYDYLSQVTIAAIPVTETENSAGGITVTVGV